MTETVLCTINTQWDPMRADYAIRKFDEWSTSDGCYSHGPTFSFDYYNGFVIHPMSVDILGVHAVRIPGDYYVEH